MEMRVLGNTGAYGTHGLTVLTVSGLRGLSSYNCPNRRFDCRVVYTNLPVPGAYRGYGGPQALFALEMCIRDSSSGGVAVGQGITRLWPDWMGALRSNSLAWAMLSAEMR